MRRGLLQDYANTTCAIATGWRAINDLERMRGHGRGEIVVDLLSKAVSLDGQAGATFSIAAELEMWFAERRERDRVPDLLLREATVTIMFETCSGAHYAFWVQSSSCIKTVDAVYTGTGELGRREAAR